MGAVLRSLLACNFCVLLKGGEKRGNGEVGGLWGGRGPRSAVWGGGGEGGRRSRGRGAGRGLVVGKEGERGPGEGAARSARPRCSPRLALPTSSGQSGASVRPPWPGDTPTPRSPILSE